MKKNSVLACMLCLSAHIAMDAYCTPHNQHEIEIHIKAIQEITQIIRKASQKAASDLFTNPTRHSNSQDISRAIIDVLEEEIEIMHAQAAIHELSEEQQKILQLLEQYLDQYQAYSSFAPSNL